MEIARCARGQDQRAAGEPVVLVDRAVVIPGPGQVPIPRPAVGVHDRRGGDRGLGEAQQGGPVGAGQCVQADRPEPVPRTSTATATRALPVRSRPPRRAELRLSLIHI